jgi:hypothetical protein
MTGRSFLKSCLVCARSYDPLSLPVHLRSHGRCELHARERDQAKNADKNARSRALGRNLKVNRDAMRRCVAAASKCARCGAPKGPNRLEAHKVGGGVHHPGMTLMAYCPSCHRQVEDAEADARRLGR